MWPPWVKLPRGQPSAASAAAPPPATLHRSSFSFKDLYSLLTDIHEDDSNATVAGPPPPHKTAAVCHRTRSASFALRSWRSRSPPSSPPDPYPFSNRIVLYFTTLRAVRPTFEACRAVRAILSSLRVAVDERDLSMDASFLAELKVLLGRRPLALPRVFIAGRCVGGADEIRALHESGELKRIVEGFPSTAAACDCATCGGAGFVLCPHCSGSHKRYSDKVGGFQTCTACNENGLVRCSDCCLPAL